MPTLRIKKTLYRGTMMLGRHLLFFGLCMLMIMTSHSAQASTPIPRIDERKLAENLQVGDIVFIRIDMLPFRKIAHDTGSWTNHVGVVIDTSGAEPMIAESTFPFSTTTPLSKFIKRSQDARVAVRRLNITLTPEQNDKLRNAALKRLGIFYDSGFNLHSKRQFCSRYAREVIKEATGVQVGNTENFATLFADNPHADLAFWRIWYFGMIPWSRETVTPASMLDSGNVHSIFDGYAKRYNAPQGI